MCLVLVFFLGEPHCFIYIAFCRGGRGLEMGFQRVFLKICLNLIESFGGIGVGERQFFYSVDLFLVILKILSMWDLGSESIHYRRSWCVPSGKAKCFFVVEKNSIKT